MRVHFSHENYLGLYLIQFHVAGVRGDYWIDLYHKPGAICVSHEGVEIKESRLDMIDKVALILPFINGKKFARKIFLCLSARQMKAADIKKELDRARGILNSSFNSVSIFRHNQVHFVSNANLAEKTVAEVRKIYKVDQVIKCLVDGIELTEESVIVAGQSILFN